MLLNLPIGPLRTFVIIAEEKSMIRATERVFLTQSALSLQMKRLEEMLQVVLFYRDRRTLTLTPDGETLLRHAKKLLEINDNAIAELNDQAVSGPIRVGFVQDFAETLLSGVLARFTKTNPAVQLHIRIGGSEELSRMVATDRLDLALYMAPSPSPGCFQDIAMHWIGNADLARRDILPIALMTEPCIFREAALRSLDASGCKYQIVAETPSLAALQATVLAGMAITCRSNMIMGNNIVELRSPHLPKLPDISLAIDVRAPTNQTVRRLRDLIAASIDMSQDAVCQLSPGQPGS